MVWLVLVMLQLCISQALSQQRSTPLHIRPLFQFPNNTWIENLAVRSNGKILLTLVTSPHLYQIDPIQLDPTPKRVATFPDVFGSLGITEIEEDVFAITTGNLSFITGSAPKSWSVWKADFRGQEAAGVSMSKITHIPEAMFLNGATTVGRKSEYLLLADSLGGVVWCVNLETSKHHAVLNYTVTQPRGTLAEGGFGVNGVHTRDGYLYFTNTNHGFFRVPIHDDGTKAGAFELLANFTPCDDFTFDRKGDAIIARGAVDVIDKVSPAGIVTRLRYDNDNAHVLIGGNTAVKFGRMESDRKTMYVTTNGGWTGKVKETARQGGRVLAIDFGEGA